VTWPTLSVLFHYDSFCAARAVHGSMILPAASGTAGSLNKRTIYKDCKFSLTLIVRARFM
jgi:hypothetical protein